MILDAFRGRALFYKSHRELCDRSGKVYGKRLFDIPLYVFKDGVMYSGDKVLLDHYVAMAATTRLVRVQTKLEKKMSGTRTDEAMRMYNKLIRVKREQLGLVELQIEFMEKAPRLGYHRKERDDAVALRDKLLGELAPFDLLEL